MSALLIKLRPTGPWRIGPDSGDRDRVDRIYHSDSLFSAVSGAMARLGELDAWLDATARATTEPAVSFSSCFPFYGETLYVVPPRNVWPPPASPKVRFKGARFVPLKVVETLISGRAIAEENWAIDGSSECLISGGAQGPFRVKRPIECRSRPQRRKRRAAFNRMSRIYSGRRSVDDRVVLGRCREGALERSSQRRIAIARR